LLRAVDGARNQSERGTSAYCGIPKVRFDEKPSRYNQTLIRNRALVRKAPAMHDDRIGSAYE